VNKYKQTTNEKQIALLYKILNWENFRVKNHNAKIFTIKAGNFLVLQIFISLSSDTMIMFIVNNFRNEFQKFMFYYSKSVVKRHYCCYFYKFTSMGYAGERRDKCL